MEAIRIRLPEHVRGTHAPPVDVTEGKFYALRAAHDLPTWGADEVAHVDLHAFSKAGGKIYLQNASRPGSWKRVTPSEIKSHKFKVSLKDDYEGCRTYSVFSPFPPELYLVPTSFRSRRILERAERKLRRGYK